MSIELRNGILLGRAQVTSAALTKMLALSSVMMPDERDIARKIEQDMFDLEERIRRRLGL